MAIQFLLWEVAIFLKLPFEVLSKNNLYLGDIKVHYVIDANNKWFMYPNLPWS